MYPSIHGVSRKIENHSLSGGFWEALSEIFEKCPILFYFKSDPNPTLGIRTRKLPPGF
jgi:hypothetical protein